MSNPPISKRLALARDGERPLAVIARASTDIGDHDDVASLYLSPCEQRRFHGYQHERRRRSYLLGRVAAKRALVALHESKAKAWQIHSGVFEQPLAEHDDGLRADVTIAHTDDQGMAVAFAPAHPLAVDIERIDSDRVETLRSQMTNAEQTVVEKQFSDEATGLTVLWTMKEALSKALKTGLTTPFHVLETCDFAPSSADGSWEARFCNFGQYQARSWVGRDVLTLVWPARTDLNTSLADWVGQ